MNEIKYSIIIPIYDTEATLKRCLDSIVAQQRADLEVILVDDGSTDNSKALCQEYCKKADYFKYYFCQHNGVSVARNYGLSVTKGEYVLFLDGDDYLENDCIATIDRVLHENDYDLLQFSSNFLVGKTIIQRKYVSYQCDMGKELIHKYAGLLCRRRINAPWGKVYKREIIHKYSISFPESISLGEDKVFNLRYIVNCKSFGIIEDSLYCTCLDNAESLSRKLRLDIEDQMAEEASLSLQAVEESSLSEELKQELFRALAFDRLRNVYTVAKFYHRSGMSLTKRYLEINRLCKRTNAERNVYPQNLFCRLCVMPVKWKLVPVIDVMAWKMAFHGIVNSDENKKNKKRKKHLGILT